MNSKRFKSPIYKSLLIFCLILFGQSVNSFAAPGDLDLSFGSGGKVVTHIQDYGSGGTAVAIQKDGKIVEVGNIYGTGGYQPFLIRYNLDGSLDNNFNNNGIVKLFSIYNSVAARSIAIQPDGKIVAAGFGFISEGIYSDFFVVRLNSDGSFDSSFNGNGFVRTHITEYENYAYSVIIQPDGKIVVSGSGNDRGNNRSKIVVVRYNSDGSLDTSFNGNGKFISQFQDGEYKSYDAVFQSDGKIVLAGSFNNYTAISFAILRLNANGSVDNSFNGNGLVLTSFDGNGNEANALTIQSDGKIVAVGYTSSAMVSNQKSFAIARYNPNGTLDFTFDGDGKVKTSISPYASVANDVLVQDNGKIIVGGNAMNLIDSSNNAVSKFAFARYNSDGSLDNTFSGDGQTIIDVGDNDSLSGIAVQSDGKIVAVGGTKKPYNGNADIAVIRLQAGELVANKTMFDFDDDGKSDISVFRPDSGVWYLLNSTSGFTAAQFGVSTDKIVPADYDGDGKTDLAVYRGGTWYIQRSSQGFTALAFGTAEDIPQPADFDGDGKADLAVFRPSNGVWYVYNLVTNQFTAAQFGAAGDKPVVGDYNGDGKADYAVFRASNGTWYIARPPGTPSQNFDSIKFGDASDKPVAADYDGDGKTDVAVYRPSNGSWYRLNSSNGQFVGTQFGISTDLPAPADYDGDGKADIAVFRNGVWYLQQSTSGFTGVQFGNSTDKPVPNGFVQ